MCEIHRSFESKIFAQSVPNISVEGHVRLFKDRFDSLQIAYLNAVKEFLLQTAYLSPEKGINTTSLQKYIFSVFCVHVITSNLAMLWFMASWNYRVSQG